MRQRMMILAAGLLVAFAGSASAQTPNTPAGFASGVVQASGGSAPTVVNGCGSCSGYSTTPKTKHSLCIGKGTESPAGCGCCASERTFFWGGCKQFFTPGQTCGKGCGSGNCGSGGSGLSRFCNHCELPKYGSGIGQPANNCAGPFSYTMR